MGQLEWNVRYWKVGKKKGLGHFVTTALLLPRGSRQPFSAAISSEWLLKSDSFTIDQFLSFIARTTAALAPHRRDAARFFCTPHMREKYQFYSHV